MIGDGMGLTQISAAMYMNNNETILEEFPIVGLHKTHSADDLITDSAAGATAFATGFKTNNGAISVDIDNQSLETILEEAENKGLATGLVATCGITHATPACFIAHNMSRENKEAIAKDYLNSNIDIAIGGGRDYFNKRETDDRNLIRELRSKSYMISDENITSFSNLNLDTRKPNILFTADKHPPKVSEGRTYLTEASLLAVDFLKQRSNKGFFIMIEASQIDWGGHDNDIDYVIDETKDFESTIRSIKDWAERDGETLVIVTADHETGGLAINNGKIGDTLMTSFTTGHHTAVMIPVFAFGPGSEKFSGVYENTDIYYKMKELLMFNTPVLD